MMALIIASHRLNINPDNVVCLMAGSFGDIVSLSVLSTLSNAFFLIHGGCLGVHGERGSWTRPA